MGVPQNQLQGMARGALLHDIGKIGILDSILLKPGKLVTARVMWVKQHTAGHALPQRVTT
ncbi:MAG: hypothetical protein HC858_07530 [Brachymonas sp.]|nr:hypothetical protein [Brachymonas sp.]